MKAKEFTVETVLKHLGKHPGQQTGEIAQAFGVDTKAASSRLCAIFKRNETMGERIKRVEIQPDPTKPHLKAFRWYLPQDFPKEGGEAQEVLDLGSTSPEPVAQVEAEPEPVVHPVLSPVTDEEPHNDGSVHVQDLLDYVAKHPGCLPEEVAAALNIENPSCVSSRLLSVLKSKKQTGRIDRVAFIRSTGHTGYRWYLPKDLPQEELDRRAAEAQAEIDRQIKAQQEKEEQERLEREAQEAEAARIQAEQEEQARLEREAQEAEEARLAEEQQKEAERLAEAAAVKTTLAQFPGLTLPQPPGEIIQQAMTDCIHKVVEVVIGMFQPQLEAAIALSLEKAFQSAPGRLTPTPPGTTRAQESKPKNKKPRVIVVGLKPELTHFIKNEFEKLDLDFFPNDCNPGPMKDKLVYADHCYLMTDKISHKHKDVVVKSKVEFTYVSGGLTSLKDNLRAMTSVACTA
jgi:flagellar biosynthesis GTPase FlhF